MVHSQLIQEAVRMVHLRRAMVMVANLSIMVEANLSTCSNILPHKGI